MFFLTISCLTTSNLLWFMNLRFQVPIQYCSLQRQTLLSSPDTYTAGHHFHFGDACFMLFVEIICQRRTPASLGITKSNKTPKETQGICLKSIMRLSGSEQDSLLFTLSKQHEHQQGNASSPTPKALSVRCAKLQNPGLRTQHLLYQAINEPVVPHRTSCCPEVMSQFPWSILVVCVTSCRNGSRIDWLRPWDLVYSETSYKDVSNQ